MTFVRNHAKGIVACDFFVVVTVTFPVHYVFVVMKVGTRGMVHHNLAAHPQRTGRCNNFAKRCPEITPTDT
jgi:hypothetical protein